MDNQQANQEKFLLEVTGLTKNYPGVIALDHVNFNVRHGEVHCLAGENGAGKSTLIEILGGNLQQNSGSIVLEGEKIFSGSPKSSQKKGIAVLHQELPVFSDMSVAENIFMSRIPCNYLGLINYKQLYQQADYWLSLINSGIDSKSILRNLPVAKQQLVSIAKAISLDAKIIFFDEPSAILTLNELKHLFNIIKNLRSNGKGIVYISHRLDEIFEIGDRVTTLKNGKLVRTSPIGSVTKDDLIKQMVGREVQETRCRSPYIANLETPPILEVSGLNQTGRLRDISFHVSAGEIVGFFGLVGAGRTEVARSILGADIIKEGTIRVNGKNITHNNPQKALRHGICLIPEDRKRQGLLLDKSIKENIALPSLSDFAKAGLWIDSKSIMKMAVDYTRKLGIKTPTIEQKSKYLSGGNQQKIVLAKWISREMQVFMFDEPTRGVDIGAKEEIKKLIVGLAEAGKAIILISSEIAEILTLSDRVLVMYSGCITADMPVSEINQEKLLKLSMGEYNGQ